MVADDAIAIGEDDECGARGRFFGEEVFGFPKGVFEIGSLDSQAAGVEAVDPLQEHGAIEGGGAFVERSTGEREEADPVGRAQVDESAG